jgi:glycerophosphoryl diester phosphodiesterase
VTRRWKIALAATGLLVAFVFLNNTTLLAPADTARPTLLAHRGLAQTFKVDGVTADTCTASRIDPPAHGFIENTLASMEAAFRAGADIVELDIHPTTDGRFAVFHDWTLDCRTDGRGVTREHTLAELKALDVGYGYTADGGKTFPLRSKGVGRMPSLDEVLATFPDQRFLIHIKSNDPAEGAALAAFLGQLTNAQRDRLIVYGGDQPVATVHRLVPDLHTMAKASLKQCLLHYLALGWTGHVPAACGNSMVLVPANYAPWLWGWPDRFVARMRGVGTPVFVLGPWDGGEFSSGIDSAEQYRHLPAGYAGGIWTNRIDLIGALAATR